MQDSPAVTLGEALGWAAGRLEAAGVEAPRREARLLAAHCLGVSPATLLDSSQAIEMAGFAALVARRASREPLAFITGRAGFWTLDVGVSPATLIPRADSEALIEAAMAALPDRGAVLRILDLGTGTGCLLLAALVEFAAAFGVGVDLAAEAAMLAGRNAAANGLAGRAAFLAGDWATALVGRFDLVLCNPPYIPAADMDALMPEVAAHEPARALDGGADGLRAYAALLPDLPGLLQPHGIAVIELGVGQEAEVSGLAQRAGLAHVTTRRDLAGVPRAMVLQQGHIIQKPFGSSLAAR